MPGSGKSSIAERTASLLRDRGYDIEVLDGDWVRKTINVGAGFTREERERHLLRVAWIARLLARHNIPVICSFVSPYKKVRKKIREIIEKEAGFHEIWVKASLQECIRRDPKGLYKKALNGEIKHMTGIDDPYEPPDQPQLILDTENNSLEKNAEILYNYIIKTCNNP